MATLHDERPGGVRKPPFDLQSPHYPRLPRMAQSPWWKNAPYGKILKSDVWIDKNYLIEGEIKELERIVTMHLDCAENQAARQIHMRMADWVAKLDAFLKFNEYEVLTNAGSVSAEMAKRLAEGQYATFRVQQDQRFESDFEKEVKRIEEKKRKEGGP